jgi:type IV secretion system protein VirB6
MAVCAALPADAGFLQSILAFLDCQAQFLGAGGYGALSTPGSTLTLVLTGFLTLFIALFGYWLLLGRGLDVRTSVVAFAKIGVVLALATSWPAYRTLVYDVVVRGPAELAGEIAGSSGLPGAGGGLTARLDGTDRAFVALTIVGEGRPAVIPANVPPEPYPGLNTFAIAGSRMIFLIGAIAGLGAVRLIAGLVLAIGPLFVAFLLFDNTRSLFEGWARVVAGAALGTLGTAVALGVELAVLEPWLYDILSRRAAREWLPGMPVELLVVTLSFALIVLAMLYASAKIAFAFRLAPVVQAATARLRHSTRAEEARAALAGQAGTSGVEDRSRAVAIVDAIAATQRRETMATNLGLADSAAATRSSAMSTSLAGNANDSLQPLPPSRIGQNSGRRTRARVSASAARRDRRS